MTEQEPIEQCILPFVAPAVGVPHPRSQFLLDRLPHRRLDQRSLLAGVERATVFGPYPDKGD